MTAFLVRDRVAIPHDEDANPRTGIIRLILEKIQYEYAEIDMLRFENLLPSWVPCWFDTSRIDLIARKAKKLSRCQQHS